MNESKAYMRIAERYIKSAETLCDVIQEGSAFCSYHAFESLGGALCRHLGRSYPKGHSAKLNQFVICASSVDRRFQKSVSFLHIVLVSLDRNKLLYPVLLPDGSFDLPENRLKPSDARDLIKRVRGIMRKLQRFLK